MTNKPKEHEYREIRLIDWAVPVGVITLGVVSFVVGMTESNLVDISVGMVLGLLGLGTLTVFNSHGPDTSGKDL